MPETKKLVVRNQVFDLDTFDDVTLVKEVEFTPIASLKDALAMVGGDESKLMDLLNVGMEDKAREVARMDSNGWRTFKKSADGDDTAEINGEFSGTPVDDTDVKALVLTIAKTTGTYGTTPESRKAAKEAARSIIKNTPVLREGLRTKALAANAPKA